MLLRCGHHAVLRHVRENRGTLLLRIPSHPALHPLAVTPGPSGICAPTADGQTVGISIYVWGKSPDTVNIRLAEVNPTNGMVRNVLNGRASLFGGSSSDAQSWGGIVTDGTGLIVHFNGQLWYVETNGRIRMPALAGVYRPGLDYPSGYDARASRPAAQVVIPEVRTQLATGGAAAWLAIDASRNLYVSARADSYYVLRLACRP